MNKGFKIKINADIFYDFLKKINYKNKKLIIDKICGFGYEYTENAFVIMLTKDTEKILGPITLAYIFSQYKSYNKFVNAKYQYYKLQICEKKINNKKLEQYIQNVLNFLNLEFGSEYIREDLFFVIDFFLQNSLKINIEKKPVSYSFEESVYRRLNTAYYKQKKLPVFKTIETNLVNSFSEYLTNIGYKEICLNPIINQNVVKNNLQNFFDEKNKIKTFLNRDYLIKYLIQSYITDFDQLYYKFLTIFTVDSVYCVQNKKDTTNILIVKTYFSKTEQHINIVRETLLFFHKKACFYFENQQNITYIFVNKINIGICGFYRKRIFVEICYNSLENLPNLKNTEKFYDYNIICLQENINKIIQIICLNVICINSYEIIDIYTEKKGNSKYTFRFFLSKNIEYFVIEQIINKYNKK